MTIPNLDFKEMYAKCDVPLSEDILFAITKMNKDQRVHALSVIEEMEAEGARTLKLGINQSFTEPEPPNLISKPEPANKTAP